MTKILARLLRAAARRFDPSPPPGIVWIDSFEHSEANGEWASVAAGQILHEERDR